MTFEEWYAIESKKDGGGWSEYGWASVAWEAATRQEQERIINRLCDVKIGYHGPSGDIQIKDQGWRLEEKRWHKTYRGRPVQKKKGRYPRWALLGVFETEREAITAAITEN